MEFTREAWENAPEGAGLVYGDFDGKPVTLIGFSTNGRPVVEDSQGLVWACTSCNLRIVRPKRKVTVQLWKAGESENLVASIAVESAPKRWTLLGEHTFEIEGE